MEGLNRIPRSTNLDYKLPSTVESIQRGWIYTFQASTLISGILAIIATIFLILNTNSEFFSIASKNPGRKLLALEIISYSSLFLNLSACLSCFILIDRLGEVPYHAAKNPKTTKGGMAALRQQGILKIYGIGALWRWVVWHWLFCFTLGAGSIFAQVVLYIFLEESKEVKIVMASLAGFCSLPFMAFILSPVVNLLISLSSSSRRASYSDGARSPTTAQSDIESLATRTPTVNSSPTRLRTQSFHTTLVRAVPPSPSRLSGQQHLYEVKLMEPLKEEDTKLSGRYRNRGSVAC